MDKQFRSPHYDPHDAGTFDRGLVFVIMPFHGDDMNNTYSAIKEACRELRLECRRADEQSGSGFVIHEITELIERAEFIICDLTNEKPNVYYELGYAHGVGNEDHDILLIAREGTVLHFDVAPLRVRYYSSDTHLKAIVATGLTAMIRATR